MVWLDPHGADDSDGGWLLVCACDGSAGDVADGGVVLLGNDGPLPVAGDLVEGLLSQGVGFCVSPPDAWVGLCEVVLESCSEGEDGLEVVGGGGSGVGHG